MQLYQILIIVIGALSTIFSTFTFCIHCGEKRTKSRAARIAAKMRSLEEQHKCLKDKLNGGQNG